MDDLISRLDAIEAVQIRIKQIGYENDPKVLSIRQAIRDVPSVEPQWIPTSEQMPPQGVEVLATCGGFVTTAEYIDNDIWFTCEGNSNATTADIDAWMPLPKPYEVKHG